MKIRIVKHTIVDVHFSDKQEKYAMKIIKAYQKRGYSFEQIDQSGYRDFSCAQLIKTKIKMSETDSA